MSRKKRLANHGKNTDYSHEFKLLESRYKTYFIFEYQFHNERRWSIDSAIPCCKLAIEIEGWGHNRPAKFTKDLEKYNQLAVLGWKLIRFTPKQISSILSVARKNEVICILDEFFKNHPCTHQIVNQAIRQLKEGQNK